VLPNRFNVSGGPQLPLLPDPTTAGCLHLHDGMPKQRDLQRECLRLQFLRRAGVLLHGVNDGSSMSTANGGTNSAGGSPRGRIRISLCQIVCQPGDPPDIGVSWDGLHRPSCHKNNARVSSENTISAPSTDIRLQARVVLSWAHETTANPSRRNGPPLW